MSELPKGWVEHTLGGLIELKYGKSLPARVRDGEGSPVYGSNGVVGLHSEPLINHEGIIIGRKGSFGEVHLSKEAFFPIDTTYFVDIIPSGTFKYWYYQLQHLPLNKLNRSTAIPGLNRDDAYAQVIFLPPEAEQKRIVDKLDEVLAQVDSIKARLDSIPDILKRFRQSVLAAAVSGKLTENVDKWKYEKLKDCFDCIDGDRGPNYPKKEDYLSEGYCLFLSTKNVRPFGFNFSHQVYITEEKDSILRRGRLERGDLIITTRGTLGYVASYDNSVPFDVVRINSGMLILRKKNQKHLNDFFKILIASPLFQKLIDTQRTGSAQPQLPANILKEFKLPIPSVKEQTEIVRFVDQYFAFADAIEKQVKNAQQRVDKLTQSVLAKAFRGELVPQNPDDEPAEQLLERIAKAKQEADALAKAAKKTVKKTKK